MLLVPLYHVGEILYVVFFYESNLSSILPIRKARWPFVLRMVCALSCGTKIHGISSLSISPPPTSPHVWGSVLILISILLLILVLILVLILLLILILICLLTAIGLTPGGSSTVHIYTQTVHRTTQLTTLVRRLSGIRTQSVQTEINDELTA